MDSEFQCIQNEKNDHTCSSIHYSSSSWDGLVWSNCITLNIWLSQFLMLFNFRMDSYRSIRQALWLHPQLSTRWYAIAAWNSARTRRTSGRSKVLLNRGPCDAMWRRFEKERWLSTVLYCKTSNVRKTRKIIGQPKR